MAGSLERITDVAPTLYIHGESRRPIESLEQIQEDLWTWWAEAELRPSPIRLSVSEGRLDDKYGNSLVLQAEAASIIRKGRVEQGRVDAEVRGVERLERLLISSEANNGVICLSPPGTKEEGFGAEGRRRLSFTYLYHVGNRGRIHFLAIPELEVSTKEHFERVKDLIDLDKTENLVGGQLGEVNSRSLVSYPLVIREEKDLDTVARRLGYENLLDMWRVALESKRLEGKVGELVAHASNSVWDAYRSKNHDRLEALGDVFRGVVALLVSNDLQDITEIKKYFDSKVEAFLSSKDVDRMGGVSSGYYEQYSVDIREFYFRLRHNERALDIVQGGSCPGNRDMGFGEGMFGWRAEIVPSNNVMLDVLGMGNPYGKNVDAHFRSEFGSTGKYTEYYDYKPGVCKHCHEHKPYVAHPKSADVQCAGWCSDCET